jgi:hypothetical protein
MTQADIRVRRYDHPDPSLGPRVLIEPLTDPGREWFTSFGSPAGTACGPGNAKDLLVELRKAGLVIREEIKAYTDSECDAAVTLFRAFLEGMPEVSISPEYPQELEIVESCHSGDVRAYLLESFENFIDQCVPEPGEEN